MEDKTEDLFNTLKKVGSESSLDRYIGTIGDKYPKDLEPRFNVLLQDIASLISHANFSFERLEYLQDTVVGLINLEQNSIMKIFTLVSLLLMPPTLEERFYGMNVKLTLAGLPWAWLVIVGVMILSLVIILFVFIRRKML